MCSNRTLTLSYRLDSRIPISLRQLGAIRSSGPQPGTARARPRQLNSATTATTEGSDSPTPQTPSTWPSAPDQAISPCSTSSSGASERVALLRRGSTPSPAVVLLVGLMLFLAGGVAATIVGLASPSKAETCTSAAARASRTHLQGVDLSGADLAGAGLCGADLRGAHLTDACLRGAHLDGADLTGAVLAGADFTGASTKGALGLPAQLPTAAGPCDVK